MPIALMARTWIGNSMPAVVLGAVSLLPSLHRAAVRRSARVGRQPGYDAAWACAALLFLRMDGDRR